MSENKNRIRILLISAMSIIICCVMLIGGTYAWFYEKVTAGITIEAETLGVDLLDADGNSLINESTGEAGSAAGDSTVVFYEVLQSGDSFVLGTAAATLWDLDKIYQTGIMTLKNTGSLDVTYTVAVEGIGESFRDAFVFEVLINGENKGVVPFTGNLAASAVDTGTVETAEEANTSDTVSLAVQGKMNADGAAAVTGVTLSDIIIKITAEQAE